MDNNRLATGLCHGPQGGRGYSAPPDPLWGRSGREGSTGTDGLEMIIPYHQFLDPSLTATTAVWQREFQNRQNIKLPETLSFTSCKVLWWVLSVCLYVPRIYNFKTTQPNLIKLFTHVAHGSGSFLLADLAPGAQFNMTTRRSFSLSKICLELQEAQLLRLSYTRDTHDAP